ncbi:MAG TPA: PadR family transcriptional regulator [Pseudogracilibacillus sp.]|nr:PadR family transcriptional regulator [Pseudogracilibacillus sp.]
MNVQFKKGVLELCVLAIVQKKDYYGYELVREISSQIAISEGTVYPLLRKLTKEGYFTTYLQESSEGPPRKYYTLTKDGERYLQKLKEEWHDFTQAVDEMIKEEKSC